MFALRRAAVIVTSLLFVSAGCAGVGKDRAQTPSANATLRTAQGETVGTVTVRQQSDDLVFTLSAHSLPPGSHGAHVHMTGQCAPDFAAAGGHWNPDGTQHGLRNPQGSHKGDLPNVEVGADGKGVLSFTVRNAALSGSEASLLDADGAAFVIHAGPDDMMTDPSGNSGGRIACGVFAKS